MESIDPELPVRPRRGARLRTLARKLGLSALTLVLFVGLGELVARLAEPGPMSLYDTRPYQDDAGLQYVHEPGFRGRWDSSWYEINSRGMRGPEVEPTFAQDEFRVVCVGDSCTFGKGVVERDSWPRQLEGLLAEHMGPDQSAVVFNLGVNGYSMWQYRRALERQIAALRPHLVIVGYNVNDYDSVASLADGMVFSGAAPAIEPSAGSGGAPGAPGASGTSGTSGTGGSPAQLDDSSNGRLERERAPAPALASLVPLRAGATPRAAQGSASEQRSSMRQRLRALLPKSLRDDLNRLALYRFMRATYYDSTRERDYAKMAEIVAHLSRQRPQVQAEVFDDEAAMLGELVDIAARVEAEVAIFLFPFEAMVYLDEFERGPEQFLQKLAEHAQIAFVDVPTAFRARLAQIGKDKRLFVRGDRYHPNAAGYEVVAGAVFAGLLEQGLLDPSR